MNDLKDEIYNWFYKDKIRNRWFFFKYGKIYLRKGHHYVDDSLRYTLDIGAVEIYKEHQRKGIFNNIFIFLEELALEGDCILYIECVLNNNLIKFLEKLGYKKINLVGHIDYYKTNKP